MRLQNKFKDKLSLKDTIGCKIWYTQYNDYIPHIHSQKCCSFSRENVINY